MSAYPYRLKYAFGKPEAGTFTKAAAAPGEGLTDALLVMSILYPPDGSYSTQFWTWDGRRDGKPLHDLDLLKVWMMLTMRLAGSDELPPDQRAFVADVADAIRAAVTGVPRAH